MPTLSKPDIAVYSPDHKLQLVVEVKGTPHSDAKWAAKLRRNLLVHGAVPDAPYFLLVLPDHLYLWSGVSEGKERPPDFQTDTEVALGHYLPRWENTKHSPISESGLELAVFSWLTQITRSPATTELNDAVKAFLTDSGLVDRVRNGIVKSEAPV